MVTISTKILFKKPTKFSEPLAKLDKGRLLIIKNEMDKKRTIDDILSTLKPPVFWKEKDIVKQQARSWSTAEVKNIIYKINDLEINIKKNSTSSLNFVSDFISNY